MSAYAARLRIQRSRSAWIIVGLLAVFALGAAWLQHRSASAHGADRALDVYATLALPCLVYAIVAASLDKKGLAGSGRSLVRLGAPPAKVARATVVVAMIVSAGVSGVLGAAIVIGAHGAADPPMAEDALHVLAFGGLAGAAYAGYFMLAGALVAGFWGRAIFLVVDWVVGSGVGLGAAFFPRANLRNLLGGEPPFDLAAGESFAVLAAIAIVTATVACWRAVSLRTEPA